MLLCLHNDGDAQQMGRTAEVILDDSHRSPITTPPPQSASAVRGELDARAYHVSLIPL